MPAYETCRRFYRWGTPSRAEAAKGLPQACQGSPAQVACEEWTRNPKLSYYANVLAEILCEGRSLAQIPWIHLAEEHAIHSEAALLRARSEQLRAEFETLAEQWRRETKFLSSTDEKILHSAYQSIIAMGGDAVPLVLEELQHRRGHWFWALHFMTKGADPVPEGANVDAAREAWLAWGRQRGYLA